VLCDSWFECEFFDLPLFGEGGELIKKLFGNHKEHGGTKGKDSFMFLENGENWGILRDKCPVGQPEARGRALDKSADISKPTGNQAFLGLLGAFGLFFRPRATTGKAGEINHKDKEGTEGH